MSRLPHFRATGSISRSSPAGTGTTVYWRNTERCGVRRSAAALLSQAGAADSRHQLEAFRYCVGRGRHLGRLPEEQKFYRGKNSARELVARDPENSSEFSIPIRGTHIYEAIFPQSMDLNAPGTWISMVEQADQGAGHYVLTVFREGTPPRLQVVRTIWISRSTLTIARQQVYSKKGELVSDITYSNVTVVEGVPLPLKIHVDRPVDRYTLDLEFKGWNVNPDLGENAFVLQPSPAYEVIELKDRGAIGN